MITDKMSEKEVSSCLSAQINDVFKIDNLHREVDTDDIVFAHNESLKRMNSCRLDKACSTQSAIADLLVCLDDDWTIKPRFNFNKLIKERDDLINYQGIDKKVAKPRSQRLNEINKELVDMHKRLQRLETESIADRLKSEAKEFNVAMDKAIGKSEQTLNAMERVAKQLIEQVFYAGSNISGVHVAQGRGDLMSNDGELVRNLAGSTLDSHWDYETPDLADVSLSCPSIFVFVDTATGGRKTIRIADHDLAREKEFLHPDHEHTDGQYLGHTDCNIKVGPRGSYTKTDIAMAAGVALGNLPNAKALGLGQD